MSIVRINAITVPEGAGEELHKRFENRISEVETMDGFESFELLRPSSESNTCLLYTSPSPRDRTRSRMPSSA